MSYHRLQLYFYLILLGASVLLTTLLFWPFLTLLAFSGVIAVISHPIHRALRKLFRNEALSAFLTVFLVLVIIVVPVSYFLIALSGEVVSLLPNVKSFLSTASVTTFLQTRIPESWLGQLPTLVNGLLQFARNIAQSISDNVIGLFSNFVSVFVGFFIVLIASYYLLKDGERMKKIVMDISPIGKEHTQAVIDRIIIAVRAVMGGVIILAIVKGFLGSIFFYFFNIPTPLFWGAMTGLATLVPIVGTSLVTIPILLYLLLQGQYLTAIIFAAVVVTVISTIDNILQPKLVQSKTKIHPLLVLLSVLGGLQFYGFSGFVLGPLTLAVTAALIDIYKKELQKFSDSSS